MKEYIKAFSLVEMLMALLVASLLLAALAPVITRRMAENMHIAGDFSNSGRSEVVDIEYGGPYCSRIITDDSNNPLYCEGEYVVPEGYRNITVTAIGAGGGGGSAPTGGYIEYTTAGSTNTFTVPIMVNQVEATLISGGAGGGAGGQVTKTQTFDTPGVSAWSDFPEIIKGKYVSVMGCGGGGGGGGATIMADAGSNNFAAGGGGTGGFLRTPIAMFISASTTSIPYQVGGGGGGGGNGGGGAANAGGCGGGGDGGVDDQGSIVNNACNPKYGGRGGSYNIAAGGGNPDGGNGNINNVYGGAGTEGGDGGKTGGGMSSGFTSGAGGGRYGGGGGGGTCTGGGGGGGGPTYFNNVLIGSGGGGGAGQSAAGPTSYPYRCSGASGGGGGGAGGGNGGSGGDAPTSSGNSVTTNPISSGAKGGAPNGFNGYYNAGWNQELVDLYGWVNCHGGNGGGLPLINTISGQSGYPGLIRVSYLDYGPGGSGGGSAGIVPIQPIDKLKPNDTLTIKIAGVSNGIPAGSIDSSGNIIYPMSSANFVGTRDLEVFGKPTTIENSDGDVILRTSYYGGAYSPNPGVDTGCVGTHIVYLAGAAGHITGGRFTTDTNTLIGGSININGFSHTYGKSADNGTAFGNITYPDGSTGGDGGTVTTPFTRTCTPGKGGTRENPKGGDASGFGCGGGGGYGLSDGGKGSGGYARISWNMFWDSALNNGDGDYRYAETGAGGGGARGNAITETVRVNSGQVIKIRIGAGGRGAKVTGNTVIPATSGGTTIFGDVNFIEIKAGGGGGGGSPYIENNQIVNGRGGIPSNICHIGSRDYHENDKYCIRGEGGNTPGENNTNPAKGGRGEEFVLTLKNRTYRGSGGSGGEQATDVENSKGKTPSSGSIASGGGGAALLIYNRVENLTQLSHPTGGNGANGKIILQLWE